MKSIQHGGQQEPAIITCDGFLINGNRRKMAMEKLYLKDPTNENFTYMHVYEGGNLGGSGKDDDGGPPTLVEIEKIENRYQLQSAGKSEYYGFDRALSIKRKIQLGFTLEEQLRDDPKFAGRSNSDIEKAKRQCTKEFLSPLECVDRYLKQFRRDGLYRTISAGMSDPEGRWQAFIDYSNAYTNYFKNPKRLIKDGIEEQDIGALEEAAFDIIRLRNIPDLPKVHVIMRNFPKYCRTKEGKKSLKKIADLVDPVLPPEKCKGDDGKPLTIREIELKWATKYNEPIIYNTKKASRSHERLKENETPVELLDTALKKLNHNNMDPSAIANADLPKARQLAADIKSRADDIESQVYHHQKEFKKLGHKTP